MNLNQLNKNKQSMNYWMSSIRPKTLLASISPCLLGISLATLETTNLSYSFFINVVNIFICALFLQISSNLINDYYDHISGVDNSARLGPQRVTNSNLIPPSQVKRAFIITLLLAFLFGIHLMMIGGLSIVAIGLLSIIFSFLYTAGPRPISHYALGEVFAFLFFGPIATWGSFYILTKNFDFYPLFIGSGIGFLSSSIMAINNIRDTRSDSLANKETLSTLFGITFLKKTYLVLILLSSFICITDSIIFKRYSFIAVTIILYHIPLFKKIMKTSPSEVYNQYLAQTAKLMFFYSLAFAIFIHFKL